MTIRQYLYEMLPFSAFKGRAKDYRTRILHAIEYLEEFLKNDPQKLDVSVLNEATLRAMRLDLCERGFAPKTAHGYTEYIRYVLRHARPEEFIQKNLPRKLEYPVESWVERPHPDTLLLVYLRHYATTAKITRSYERSLWSVIDKLSESLREPARLRHLNDENVTAMLKLCEQQKLKQTTIYRYRVCIKSLWRRAVEHGLVAHGKLSVRRKMPGSGAIMKNVPVTGDEGGLWWLCLNRFFPVNTRIQTEQTKFQYQFAMRSFKTFLGHEPGLSDLTDDTVTAWAIALRDQETLERVTINERVGRIITLWTWLAKKRLVHEFPYVPRLKQPKRTPRCWTLEEIRKIFETAQNVKGKVGQHRAADWWTALLLTLWDSAARIGEIIATEWAWLDRQTGVLCVPAEVRKGGERDMVYRLHAETLAALQRIAAPSGRMFDWPLDYALLFGHFKRIVIAAGLPYEAHHSGFHRIRRTVASYVHAAGHDATALLQHSTPSVTIGSYLDPAICSTVRPCDILPRMGRKDGDQC